MHTLKVIKNQRFIGRYFESKKLAEIAAHHTPAIIIIYGRRRVGKTELLEQTFTDRNLLKFEGLEGQDQPRQMRQVMSQLAEYTGEDLLRHVEINNWIDVFTYINKYTIEGRWTIYFEELQWLADYDTAFIAELKYAWDNLFRRNSEIIVILCGSSPSFMINNVVHSRSLYNRSQHEIYLKELNIIEAKQLLSKYPARDVMDAYLTLGGIPEYLQKLKNASSLFTSLCDHSFKKDGFFTDEYQRIFVSSLAQRKDYQATIDFLSKKRFATREEIAKHLKITAGGTLTELLNDLDLCGFISRYAPYHLSNEGKLVRYCIQDAYLQFYYKFIHQQSSHIQQGRFDQQPSAALNRDTYAKWLGFSFERFCRRYAHIIARILGFSSIQYQSGSYFNRSIAAEEPDFQIDLVFDRNDGVMTICEIKYLRNKLNKAVISEFEKKVSLIKLPKNKMIHKVLITANEEDKSDLMISHFDQVISLDELFDEHYW